MKEKHMMEVEKEKKMKFKKEMKWVVDSKDEDETGIKSSTCATATEQGREKKCNNKNGTMQ